MLHLPKIEYENYHLLGVTPTAKRYSYKVIGELGGWQPPKPLDSLRASLYFLE